MIEINDWHPDPAWDYAQLWDYLRQIKMLSEQTAMGMAESEDATKTSDAQIKEQFLQIQALCIRALDNLGESDV